jgi:hypothetical protein
MDIHLLIMDINVHEYVHACSHFNSVYIRYSFGDEHVSLVVELDK